MLRASGFAGSAKAVVLARIRAKAQPAPARRTIIFPPWSGRLGPVFYLGNATPPPAGEQARAAGQQGEGGRLRLGARGKIGEADGRRCCWRWRFSSDLAPPGLASPTR